MNDRFAEVLTSSTSCQRSIFPPCPTRLTCASSGQARFSCARHTAVLILLKVVYSCSFQPVADSNSSNDNGHTVPARLDRADMFENIASLARSRSEYRGWAPITPLTNVRALQTWCPCMAINVSVEYNGGLLPDIILLTQCYCHRGTRLNAMKRFCICSL